MKRWHRHEKNRQRSPGRDKDAAGERRPARGFGPDKDSLKLPAGIPDPRELALLDAQEESVLRRPISMAESLRIPIEVEGELVGWLLARSQNKLSEGFDLQFVEQQRETMLLAGLLVLLLSALLAFPIARHLVRPIRELAEGTARLADGEFGREIRVKRRDELGQLARDFNELSRSLAANQDSRQRWFAAISHELRTPLAILRGEIEALLDGVRPLDMAGIQSLAEETQQLTRLVEDLYALSSADIGTLQYRKESVDMGELVAATLKQHLDSFNLAQLAVDWQAPTGVLLTWGDPARLRQLLDNRLVNSIR